MDIKKGNFITPKGEAKNNYYRVRRYKNGKVTQAFISIDEHGEEEAKQLVKQFFDKPSQAP